MGVLLFVRYLHSIGAALGCPLGCPLGHWLGCPLWLHSHSFDYIFSGSWSQPWLLLGRGCSCRAYDNHIAFAPARFPLMFVLALPRRSIARPPPATVPRGGCQKSRFSLSLIPFFLPLRSTPFYTLLASVFTSSPIPAIDYIPHFRMVCWHPACLALPRLSI